MFQYGIKFTAKNFVTTCNDHYATGWGEMFKTPMNLGVLDYKSGYMLAVIRWPLRYSKA